MVSREIRHRYGNSFVDTLSTHCCPDASTVRRCGTMHPMIVYERHRRQRETLYTWRASGTGPTPGYQALMARVVALRALIEHEAEETERLGHLSDAAYEALRGAGLRRMLMPRALGGAEPQFSEAMRLAEAVAACDGSAGWCLMVAGVQHGTCGSLIEEAGCAEVWSAGLATNAAGQGIPRGVARAVPDGYTRAGNGDRPRFRRNRGLSPFARTAGS
ncbi:MAG: hypothetical protein K2Y51_03735 [Gammaproteobacteria bacterium]|nr:hypothetical protein [Gammaproteobacteria bacterium]